MLLLDRLGVPLLVVLAEHDANVCGNASAECGNDSSLDAVATFQDGNDASLGMGVSNLAQFLGEPLVVRLLDSQVDWTLNVILGVGVEAGRDDDKIGLERGDGG